MVSVEWAYIDFFIIFIRKKKKLDKNGNTLQISQNVFSNLREKKDVTSSTGSFALGILTDNAI